MKKSVGSFFKEKEFRCRTCYKQDRVLFIPGYYFPSLICDYCFNERHKHEINCAACNIVMGYSTHYMDNYEGETPIGIFCKECTKKIEKKFKE